MKKELKHTLLNILNYFKTGLDDVEVASGERQTMQDEIDYVLPLIEIVDKKNNNEKLLNDKIKNFIISLRKQHQKIEEKQFFCDEHNFKLEAESKKREANIVRRIIHEMEKDFDLGFVWDESLDK